MTHQRRHWHPSGTRPKDGPQQSFWISSSSARHEHKYPWTWTSPDREIWTDGSEAQRQASA